MVVYFKVIGSLCILGKEKARKITHVGRNRLASLADRETKFQKILWISLRGTALLATNEKRVSRRAFAPPPNVPHPLNPHFKSVRPAAGQMIGASSCSETLRG